MRCVAARLKSHYFSPIDMSLGRRTGPERNGTIALGWALVAGSRAEAGLPVRAAQPLRPSPAEYDEEHDQQDTGDEDGLVPNPFGTP